MERVLEVAAEVNQLCREHIIVSTSSSQARIRIAGKSKMSIHKHSEETRKRIKANSEAAKKRLARLNQEYQVREQVRRTKIKPATKVESFGAAVARIARETN